jgi:signal transduction histidine kinase
MLHTNVPPMLLAENVLLAPDWLYLCIVLLLALYILGKLGKKVVVRQKIFKLLMERKTREVNMKNEELEKNNIIKTRLISIISHDLISPLRFIHLTSKQLLENRGEMSEELLNEMLQEIAHSSKELELLSTNILNWIKYQNENRRMKKEEFDLHQMVSQIFGIFQGLARQKKIQFVNQIHDGLVLYQFMEPIRIVLYNIILNALNFTEKGNITISGGHTSKGILVKIRDEGIGMTQEQISNIMSEHFIVSSANVNNRKGNGLGYLIIKDLLKLVDAKFVIKSQKNKGTMVSIFLPVE